MSASTIVGDLQIDAERLQRAVCFLEFLGNVVSDDLERTFRIVTRDFGNLVFGTWSVKCTNRHIHTFRQNLGKLLCVHACAAVHLGRIFTGKDVNLHICALLFESGSCSITTVRQFFNETPDCFIRVTKFCIFSDKPRTNGAVIRDSHVKAGLHSSRTQPRFTFIALLSDGSAVLIEVRIVFRIACGEEQAEHADSEDDGDRGDQPHGM